MELIGGDPRGQIEGFGKLVEVNFIALSNYGFKLIYLFIKVSTVHRRFVQALEMVTALRGMYSRLSHINDLLSADRSDPLGSSPNLLPAHYHLSELETFRNETLAQAKRGKTNSEAIATLEQYFGRLGETIEAFEAHYFRLAGELIEFARKGQASIAVKIAKIAEIEGARDEKAIAIKMVKKSHNVHIAARFRSVQADARTIKHYRSRVMDAIRANCKSAIERSYARHGENGIAWMDEMDWVYEDLSIVQEELVPMFPLDWKVSQFYIYFLFAIFVNLCCYLQVHTL